MYRRRTQRDSDLRWLLWGLAIGWMLALADVVYGGPLILWA